MGLAFPPSRTSEPTGAAVFGWAGALTPTSFVAVADVTQTARAGALEVSTNADMSSPVFTSAYQVPTLTAGSSVSYQTLKVAASGLTPNTKYYWRFIFQDAASQGSPIHSLTTAPAAGVAASFRFTFGSCTNFKFRDSAPVFRSIALEAPLFFMHIGDINYSDVATTDIRLQRSKNSRIYRSSADVDAMHRAVPIVYMLDDHDIGPNDCSLDTTNGEVIFQNSRAVVRETTPMYATVQDGLGETNIDRNILSQVFDIALCRFMVLDCHSQRRLSTLTALGSGLGSGDYWDQLTWLGTALTQAAADGMKQVFLVITSTWSGGVYIGYGDVYTAERQAICDLIEACDVPVTLLVGDAHESCFDDGTNTALSTSGFAFFPQIMSSPIVQTSGGSIVPSSWNGSAKKFRTLSQFTTVDVAADNLSWTGTAKGLPIDGSYGPTTLGSVVSTDVTPAVSFNTAAPSVAHGSPLTVNLNKTWFGPCSVHWASSDGQSGNVTFKPNRKRASFSVTFAAAGSPTITLSSPSGCTISGTNPATVTVT